LSPLAGPSFFFDAQKLTQISQEKFNPYYFVVDKLLFENVSRLFKRLHQVMKFFWIPIDKMTKKR
jgi:hypothetical protein